jgi:molybdopterin/thiamine biosynthesis adenylyltransferase
MNDQQLLRYGRHLLLEEVGIEGQERLLGATALIVGAGGLGSPAALYLASAGIGRLILADGDIVELSNLQRQILHRNDSVGLNKAESGCRTLRALNPDVDLVGLPSRLSGALLERTVREADVVLDCTDNFATRHAINRACFTHGVPLVSGAALRFDGQMTVFDPRVAHSPCYHCVFPSDEAPEEVRCAVMGVFAPLTGLIGTMQAAEALKIVGGFGKAAIGRLLMVSLNDLHVESIELSRKAGCSVCAARPHADSQGNVQDRTA